MKTGILGGTFNPIHLAHLRIAEEVREACGLDRVLFLVADTPPHKRIAARVPFATRLAMVEVAIADHPAFAACAIEREHPGPNYTVDTLQRLHELYPQDEFYFIIGFDSFRDLPSWKDYARIPELTNLVVAHRPGAEATEPMQLLPVAVQKQFCYSCSPEKWRHRSGNWLIFLQETRLDISSTAIRRLVAERRSIRYLVPDPVVDLIEREQLYRI
ncbi:nicotinate-nucleotide adenylyltransferase [Geothermobacter ehrlichii]|uniref:Probable nicotinate-nucleotide adenylyltransferase n=1 Tax=Geothermobacter ehrlichii TaxID=213224 RepID=A0A5D3WHS0_9BACT|nr:nicotinate-nucleotide adenylyltransferase [Geothermobacter ehrlichii]TYO96617.1 nicotinate-nucleotide adenylyltransferase [Geothermobacter ehrlichii]